MRPGVLKRHAANKAIILTQQTIVTSRELLGKISGAAPQTRHAGRRKAASQLYGLWFACMLAQSTNPPNGLLGRPMHLSCQIVRRAFRSSDGLLHGR